MKIWEIEKGDIVTYQTGRINYVNKPQKYAMYFNNDFENYSLDLDIIKIQRYVKFLCFYRLKTIYKRGK